MEKKDVDYDELFECYRKYDGVKESSEDVCKAILKAKHDLWIKMVADIMVRYNEDPLSISLEEYKILAKQEKLSLNDIKLNFVKRDKDVGFAMMPLESYADSIEELNAETCKMIMMISLYTTIDSNKIRDKNSKRITSIKDISKFVNLQKRTFYRKIMPDIKKYAIIRSVYHKETNNKYLLLNPFFNSKSRKITDLMFEAFKDVFKEKLLPLEYNYLNKYFG